MVVEDQIGFVSVIQSFLVWSVISCLVRKGSFHRDLSQGDGASAEEGSCRGTEEGRAFGP